MNFLGIETSCDECSASVVQADVSELKFQVKSLETFSQIKLHEPYGGVVPEVASRNHLETIQYVIDQAIQKSELSLKNIDGIAVTNRPGLVGALLVGVCAAKALAYALKKPLIPVHHLEGHSLSVYLDHSQPTEIQYPCLYAIISGGHTNLYLAKEPPQKWGLDFLKTSLIGKSRDDAAGEAFDKTAKLLGFPYPGGKWIDQTAQKYSQTAQNRYAFPKALPQKEVLDFSFSGLKTAVKLEVEKIKTKKELDTVLPEISFAIQKAIVDALIGKIKLGVEKYHCKSLALVGGVAANSYLRKELKLSIPIFFPKPDYCTDNAAMIAAAGAVRYSQGHTLSFEETLTLNAIANP